MLGYVQLWVCQVRHVLCLAAAYNKNLAIDKMAHVFLVNPYHSIVKTPS